MKQNVYDYSFEMSRMHRRRITFVLTLVISVILFTTVFLNFILFPVRVSSDTMGPDIPRGAAVFVCPLLRTPHRGDVVYLSRQDGERLSVPEAFANSIVEFFTLRQYSPFGHTRRMTGKPVIRRVLALPGDTIYMSDYLLYVYPAGSRLQHREDEELPLRPYNVSVYSVPAEWNGMGSSGTLGRMTLGDDEYFVLADNRVEGTDSRIWGAVPASRIKGRVLLEYFPFSKVHFF